MEPKRIIFQGRILNKDDQPLQDCKLKDGLTVVVQASAPGAATPSPSPSPAAAGAAGAAPAATPNPAATAAQAMQGLGLGGGLGAMAGSPMGQAVGMVARQPGASARECLTTLTKVIDNIVAHPTEDKYRKIKRANAGFSRKVDRGWGVGGRRLIGGGSRQGLRSMVVVMGRVQLAVCCRPFAAGNSSVSKKETPFLRTKDTIH